MDEMLRLEYVCTPAEIEEAQNLLVRKRIGGGSKWLTQCILLLMLTGMLLAAYARFPPPFRYYVFALMAIMVVVSLWHQRRKKEQQKNQERLPVAVEITTRDIRLASKRATGTAPWSAFGKIVESDTLFVLPDRAGFQLYVFPKRVFPNEESCDWFREIAAKASEATLPFSETPGPSVPIAGPALELGAVTLEFRLQYRDYVDRALASWRTLGFMIFIGTLLLGTFAVVARTPPPNAVFSTAQFFLLFVTPFLLVLELMLPLVAATLAWLGHRRYLIQQAVTISERGIADTSADGRSTTGWESPTRYKETPWSFILWWPGTQVWLQLPKRAFPTIDGPARCREILARHAKSSTWYFG